MSSQRWSEYRRWDRWQRWRKGCTGCSSNVTPSKQRWCCGTRGSKLWKAKCRLSRVLPDCVPDCVSHCVSHCVPHCLWVLVILLSLSMLRCCSHSVACVVAQGVHCQVQQKQRQQHLTRQRQQHLTRQRLLLQRLYLSAVLYLPHSGCEHYF